MLVKRIVMRRMFKTSNASQSALLFAKHKLNQKFRHSPRMPVPAKSEAFPNFVMQRWCMSSTAFL